jgi:AraC-like DNA-binding protein
MENACQLLRRTAMSVTDIALSVGFNSSQYFSTVFRRYTGRTPGAFRQTSTGRELNTVARA